MSDTAIIPANAVVIDDGTREYRLVNTFGQEICKVHFRPADYSIVDRITALQSDFKSITEPLKSVSLKNDGTAAFEEDWGIIKAVEQNLTQKLGEVFDSGDIPDIFTKRNAFSSIGGEFYCFRVIDALTNLVKQEAAKEAALSNQRMGKYLNDLEDGGNVGAASTGA